jgi:hypothetical protein
MHAGTDANAYKRGAEDNGHDQRTQDRTYIPAHLLCPRFFIYIAAAHLNATGRKDKINQFFIAHCRAVRFN